MWKPTRLALRNLMTHQESEFLFMDGHAVMIVGENNVDDDPDSNGSGKSALIEALSLAFTGESIRDVTIDAMIMDGKKSAEVEFTMCNSVTGDKLDIYRTFFRAKDKSSILKIWENRESDLPMAAENDKPRAFDKVASGNAFILSAIGITKTDLYNYYIVSKKKYKSFFYSTDMEKRKLIARFSKSDIIDGTSGVIASDCDVFRSEIVAMEKDLNILDGKKLAYSEQLDADKKEAARELMIATIRESIENRRSSIADLEVEITSAKVSKTGKIERRDANIEQKKKSEELLAQLKRDTPDYAHRMTVKEEELSVLENDLKDVNSSISDAGDIMKEYVKTRDSHTQNISDIKKRLLGVVTCPKCSNEFSIAEKISDKDIKSIRKHLQEYEFGLSGVEESIAEIALIIAELESDKEKVVESIDIVRKGISEISTSKLNYQKRIDNMMSDISSKESLLSISEDAIKKVDSSILALKEQIASIEKMIKKDESDIEEINNRKKDEDDEAILEKISQVDAEMVTIRESILSKESEIASRLKWDGLFKLFNVKLSNKAVKSIQALSNDYLKKMNSNLSLNVEGYKVNKDGTVNNSITAHVLRNGVQEGVFNRFSEGEKARMDICSILASQQLLNMSCNTGGLDMLFTDEITESLDVSGVENIAHGLNIINRTVVIITHASGKTEFPNVVKVTKSSYGSIAERIR